MQGIDLAKDFAPATEDDWRLLVDKALKGASFDSLRTATDNASTIEPLYAGRRDRSAEAGRLGGKPWTIVTRIEHPDPVEANRLILDDLNGGAGGLDLILASSNHARGVGLVIETLEDLDRLLEGVYLDLVSLRVDAGHDGRPVVAMLLALAEMRGIPASALDIRAAVDPVGSLAHDGRLSAPVEKLAPRLWDLLAYADKHGLKGSMSMADGRIWHAAGASDAQELAYTLASAVTLLRAVEAGNIPGLVLQDCIDVVLAADADQFSTIAKFRAMRRLWARMLDASGLEQRKLNIHAETAWRMMSQRDPWVNMLRTTVAAFAAGIGGADSITVLPFTAALGVPDEFARRIARNTQSILLEESNLYRVADPAAGSGVVEARTDELARHAWALFREVEAAGGIVQAYADGLVAPKIAEVRKARQNRVATRRDPLTGTSAFANLAERDLKLLDCHFPELGFSSQTLELPAPGKGELVEALIAASKDGAALSDMALARRGGDPIIAERLPVMRLAEPFEALRDAADQFLEVRGNRPGVFLATIGKPSDYAARASWVRNVFTAGGIEAVSAPSDLVVGDADAVAAAFRASGLESACLCSSDALYGAHAVETVLALKEAGAVAVYIAGRSGAGDNGLDAVGIAEFIHEGCDILAALQGAHEHLGLGDV